MFYGCCRRATGFNRLFTTRSQDQTREPTIRWRAAPFIDLKGLVVSLRFGNEPVGRRGTCGNAAWPHRLASISNAIRHVYVRAPDPSSQERVHAGAPGRRGAAL